MLYNKFTAQSKKHVCSFANLKRLERIKFNYIANKVLDENRIVVGINCNLNSAIKLPLFILNYFKIKKKS